MSEDSQNSCGWTNMGKLAACKMDRNKERWKQNSELDMVVHAHNPGTQESEAGEIWVQSQHGLHTETCVKDKTN